MQVDATLRPQRGQRLSRQQSITTGEPLLSDLKVVGEVFRYLGGQEKVPYRRSRCLSVPRWAAEINFLRSFKFSDEPVPLNPSHCKIHSTGAPAPFYKSLNKFKLKQDESCGKQQPRERRAVSGIQGGAPPVLAKGWVLIAQERRSKREGEKRR